MTRDHLLGFPALTLAAEHDSSRSPVYGLGIPNRVYDEVNAKGRRCFAKIKAVVAFEQGDHTPEHMRPPAAPAAPDAAAPAVGFAVGDVVRMTLRSASYCGRRATVLERSLSGTTMRVHFDGEATPDRGWYVVWAFERVAQ